MISHIVCDLCVSNPPYKIRKGVLNFSSPTNSYGICLNLVYQTYTYLFFQCPKLDYKTPLFFHKYLLVFSDKTTLCFIACGMTFCGSETIKWIHQVKETSCTACTRVVLGAISLIHLLDILPTREVLLDWPCEWSRLLMDLKSMHPKHHDGSIEQHF